MSDLAAPHEATDIDESLDARVRRVVARRLSAIVPHAAAFVGIAALGFVETCQPWGIDAVVLLASLGASAVLVFGVPESPMASPRSVIGGHVVSALVGVSCFKLAGSTPWLSGALAVALALLAMQRTRTTHPPGGATALLANIGPVKVKALGFAFAFAPVLIGAGTLVGVGLAARSLARRLGE